MSKNTGIEKASIKQIVTLAKQRAKKRGVTLATVSRMIHGDHEFFYNLERGKTTVTLRKYDEMLKVLISE